VEEQLKVASKCGSPKASCNARDPLAAVVRSVQDPNQPLLAICGLFVPRSPKVYAPQSGLCASRRKFLLWRR
jgi:hypothetical protein